MVKAIIIGIVLSLLLAGGWLMTAGKPHKMQEPAGKEDAVAYANTAFAAISRQWDPQELTSRAAPKLVLKDGKTPEQSMQDYQALGTLTTKGDFKCNLYQTGPQKIEAICSDQAAFPQGTAFISLNLVKDGGNWQISNFIINTLTGK